MISSYRKWKMENKEKIGKILATSGMGCKQRP